MLETIKQLIQEQSPSWEANSGYASQGIPECSRNRMFVFTAARPRPLSSPYSPIQLNQV